MRSKRFRRVAVLMGGISEEREVSLRSGAAVVKGLREAGYDVEGIDVRSTDFELPDRIEAVFIALHGAFGEDGEIQARLGRMGVAYAGSGPEASRAAFDKAISKEIFIRHGIPTPDYEILEAGGSRSLSLPVVVKPTRQGSSIGVHRVFGEEQWPDAFADALRFGRKVVVESFIPGREITVGVVDGEALPVVEIATPRDDWYDYEAKYTAGTTEYIVPAPLAEDVYGRCQEEGLKTYHALGCRGFARVDFRLSGKGEVYVLELNSIPGFTETSLLPKAALEAGMSFSELCHRIVSSAAVS